MFDIGFSELVIIALVTLLVVGPERLPKVARTLGHLFGRMQRYVNDVKSDISREIQLDELRKMQTSVQEAARDFEQSVSREANKVEQEARAVTDSLEKAGREGGEPPTETETTRPAAPAAGTTESKA
ncbi:MAG: Sec-independent protein translocase protein TatB [Pseudomonadota bacterium]